MKRPIAGALTLVALLTSPLVASGHAAAKACKLVTDAKNDATAVLTPSGLTMSNEPAYDILSADFASDTKRFAVVIRVAKLVESVPTSPAGSVYKLSFTLPKTGKGNTFALIARISSSGKQFRLARKTGDVAEPWRPFGAADGIFDVKRNEVRIWADNAAFDTFGKLVKGGPVATLQASAGRIYAQQTFEDDTDSATSKATYKAGTPSCLSIGR